MEKIQEYSKKICSEYTYIHTYIYIYTYIHTYIYIYIYIYNENCEPCFEGLIVYL
jgi:hypothetical protein